MIMNMKEHIQTALMEQFSRCTTEIAEPPVTVEDGRAVAEGEIGDLYIRGPSAALPLLRCKRLPLSRPLLRPKAGSRSSDGTVPDC